jgi:hypothetical protein
MPARWRRVLTSTAVLTAFALLPVAPALGVTVTGFLGATGGLTADDPPYCTGSPVTISGSGFVNDGPTSSVRVTFNGVAATVVQIGSDNTIYVNVPKGATTGPISVVTAAGSATTPTSAVIIPCPGREGNIGPSVPVTVAKASISSFSPAKGKVGARVTIKGTGLGGATAVKFAGVKSAFKVVSSTKITAVVPAKAKTGKISVVTPAGTLRSAQVFTRL